MPRTIIKIKTWVCPSCGYHQDFDPDNTALMRLHFPDVEVGCCPACFLGQCPDRTKKKTKMVKETDPAKKTTLTIMGEEEVDTLEVQTGETDEKGNPKMRKLTAKEKQEKITEIREAVKTARELEDK